MIQPLLAQSGHEPIAKVCIGSVKGDLHDIGKNLGPVMMLKGSGFEVEDLGVDCRIEHFQAAVDRGAQVVCLSALLSTTREEMRPVTHTLLPMIKKCKNGRWRCSHYAGVR